MIKRKNSSVWTANAEVILTATIWQKEIGNCFAKHSDRKINLLTLKLTGEDHGLISERWMIFPVESNHRWPLICWRATLHSRAGETGSLKQRLLTNFCSLWGWTCCRLVSGCPGLSFEHELGLEGLQSLEGTFHWHIFQKTTNLPKTWQAAWPLSLSVLLAGSMASVPLSPGTPGSSDTVTSYYTCGQGLERQPAFFSGYKEVFLGKVEPAEPLRGRWSSHDC